MLSDPATLTTRAAIQAAIDAAGDAGGGVVRLPATAIDLDGPLTLKRDRVGIQGTRGKTDIHLSSTTQGVLAKVGMPEGPLDLVPSLVPGPGYAWDLKAEWSGGQGRYINLRESEALFLGGFTALTLEFFIKSDLTSTGYRALFHAYGRRYESETPHDALRVTTLEGTSIQVSMAIGGTQVTLGAAGLDGTAQHVRIRYDGATVKLFLKGVLAATAAASGTIRMREWADFTIGMCPDTNPMVNLSVTGSDTIDSIRMFYVAIGDGASFTPPTTKHLWDGTGTIFVMNFDRCDEDYVVQTAEPGYEAYFPTVYFPIYRGDFPVQPDGNFIRGLTITKGGILVNKATRARVVDCEIHGRTYGLFVTDNCFYFGGTDLEILMDGAHPGYALAATHASGTGPFERLNITGRTVLVAGGHLRNAYLNYAGADYAFRCINPGGNDHATLRLDSVGIVDEGGVGASAMICLDQLLSAQFSSCGFERVFSDGPVFDIGGDMPAQFDSPLVNTAPPGTAEAFRALEVIGSRARRVKLINPSSNSNEAPAAWSLTADLVEVVGVE